LADFLDQIGFWKGDISDLRMALGAETEIQEKAFGAKVAGWLDKAMIKVAQGGFKISVEVASNVLSQTLKSYYGL
jgi:hypothetical protein